MASSYRTLNLDVLTVKNILVKSATNSNIPINTVLASDGRGGTSWRNPNILFASSLSTISSLTYELTYGLSTITYPGYGLSSLSSIVSYGLSSILADSLENPGVITLSSIVSYGLSSVAVGSINPGVSSLSSIVSYGLSTIYSPYGVSSLSSIVSYGLSTVASGSINPGVSSLSSIVSYGLSTVYSYAASLDNGAILNIVQLGLSTVATNPILPGLSSLSSIVSYGLSSLSRLNVTGISSLSSIVSYGLSSFSFASVPFNTPMYGNGATTQFLNGPNNPSQINDLNGDTFLSYAYNSNVWVAGGFSNSQMPIGLMYSTDGLNWNNCTLNTGTPFQVLGLNYTGSYFVGLTADSAGAALFRIYSSDGISWTRPTGNLSKYKVNIGYSASPVRWVIIGLPESAGNPLTTMRTTTDITSGSAPVNITSGGFNISGANVKYNNNLWVAVGLNSNNTSLANVQYSGNGLNWSNASNVTLQSSSNILRSNSDNVATYGGTSIAYADSRWYVAGAGGTTSNPIYTSSNGINYTAIRTSDTSNINIFYDLEYNNVSDFYALANIRNLQSYSGTYLIGSSNNCSNWIVITSNTRVNQYQNGMAIGIIRPKLQTKSLFTNNIYSDTVNAAYLTGDGNAITNLNMSALSNSLSQNITTVSNSLAANITTLSNSLSENIATNTANIETNTTNITTNTANIVTNATNITNVRNFFTAYTINLNNTTEYTVDQDTRSSNNNTRAGIILSNVFSLSNIGTYRFNMKIKTSVTGNPITARPILYFAPSNYAMENGTNTVVYLTYKAMYQLNPYYNFHTMNDYIVIPSGFTSQSVNVGPHHLWYSEQNSSSSNYELKLTFSDITIQRIA